MKQFRCQPGENGVFFLLLFIGLWFLHMGHGEPREPVYLILCSLLCLIFLFAAFWSGFHFPDWVILESDHILYKSFLPWNCFRMDYDSCNVRLEYEEILNTRSAAPVRTWWICLYVGAFPPLEKGHTFDCVSTLRCKPGFIRFIYSRKAYDRLLPLLSPGQRITLKAAWHRAAYDQIPGNVYPEAGERHRPKKK